MDCRPCGKDGCNGTKRSLCLEAIELDDVLGVINRKLEAINEDCFNKKEV